MRKNSLILRYRPLLESMHYAASFGYMVSRFFSFYFLFLAVVAFLCFFKILAIIRPFNIWFQNKVVQENNELRHKVVYLGSRCEQVEAELVQTKDYLQSEISKAKVTVW